MEYFFHIKPTFDCILCCQNFSKQLQQNKIHSFLINTEKDIFPMSFFPTNRECNTSKEFTVFVNLKSKVLDNNPKNVQLVIFPESNLLLNVHERFEQNARPFFFQSKLFSFGGQSHNVYYAKNSPFCLRVENAKHKFLDAEFNARIQDLTFKTSTNSLFCYGKTFDEKFVVCIVKFKDEKYSLTALEQVDLLETKSDKIVTLKMANDMFSHAYTNEYSFSPDLKVEKNLVLTNDDELEVKKRQLVPYAFFDAVKCKNFDLARSFLAPSLAEKLSDRHFENYFGDFVYCCQAISQNEDEIALVCVTKEGQNVATIFKILQEENGVIADIKPLGD
jgi:hypothetical protein